MAIISLTGNPGSGKTLALIWQMRRLKARGYDCYANFHTRNLADFCTWPEFLDLCSRRSARPRALFLDEAQIWFPSRDWAKSGWRELAKFQQHRKNGVDIYYSAQNMQRVDVGIRELTAFEWQISRFWRVVRIRRTCPDQEKPGVKQLMGNSYFFASNSIYGSYWTQEIVGDRFGDGYDWGTSSLYSERIEVHRVEAAIYSDLGFPVWDRVVYTADPFQERESLLALGVHPNDITIEPQYYVDGVFMPRVVSSVPSAREQGEPSGEPLRLAVEVSERAADPKRKRRG